MRNPKKYFRFFLCTICITIIAGFSGCEDNEANRHFHNLIERANMVFLIPDSFKKTDIITNKQVKYDFAFKTEDGVECRYVIIPYDSLLLEYNDLQFKKKNGIKLLDSNGEEYERFLVDPNNLHKSLFQTYVYNICEKTDSSLKKAMDMIGKFPDKGVKNEFHADYGEFSGCYLDKEFGQEYKFCNVHYIHKKDFGMAIIFRLYKDLNHFNKLIMESKFNIAFHNLRFYNATPPKIVHPKGLRRILKYSEWKN